MELRFERICKSYGKKQALTDFSVTLGEGVHALLGPNGAGKSTLMNILAGLLLPTAGRILVDGRDTRTMGAEFRGLLGFMPQELGFYPSFTARETLEYYSALREVKNSSARIDELLRLVNLWEDRHRRVGGFSGGMKRRLGVALALLSDPAILILDEPTAGLDPRERMRFRTMISQLGEGKIVILATHIVSDVESISDDVLLLRDGRLARTGTVAELCGQVRGAVWELPMTEAEAEGYIASHACANIIKHDGCTFVRTVSRERPAPDAQPVEAGLEDVYMHCFGEGCDEAAEC